MKIPGYKISIEFYLEQADGTEVTYVIHGQVSPYDSGVYWGLPENCYPEEGGEVEMLHVDLPGGHRINADALLDHVSAETADAMESALEDAREASQPEGADYEPDESCAPGCDW